MGNSHQKEKAFLDFSYDGAVYPHTRSRNSLNNYSHNDLQHNRKDGVELRMEIVSSHFGAGVEEDGPLGPVAEGDGF